MKFHLSEAKDAARSFYKRLDRQYKKIFGKEEHIHPHQLRHSLGHHLRVNLGLDLEQIREKLRHKQLATTQIYASSTKEEVDDLIDKEWFEAEKK